MSQFLDPLLNSPLLALFVIIGLGLILGNLEFREVSLGTSGVIFVALLAGHLGFKVPAEAGQIGLALFVYCVGIGAGARFFSALKREGSQLARLAIIMVGSGALATVALAAWFDLGPALATGIFAGALTSTPALAAAIEGAGAAGSDVVVGYGIAYPFGVIGVVLFVQLLPRLLRIDLSEEPDSDGNDGFKVERQLVEVTNPNLFGRRMMDTAFAEIKGCQVSRIYRNDRLEPIQFGESFAEGQHLLLVGEQHAVRLATELIGRPSTRPILLDADNERQTVVVTRKQLAGMTVAELDPLKNHSVVITRVSRMEFSFVPHGTTRLEPNDILTVVGTKENLTAFEKFVGHRPQSNLETSLVSMAIGLTLGIALGRISFPLPGGDSFSLGLAGGPLLAALLLGHMGRFAGIVGYIPRPTRLLLQEMGLVFFLADAGIKGGAAMVDAVAQQGFSIFAVGAVVTLVPMVVGYFVARRTFRMSLWQSLGGICGGMTSTPALGAIVAKTTRQTAIVSYATVYPVAVILVALLAKLLLRLIA